MLREIIVSAVLGFLQYKKSNNHIPSVGAFDFFVLGIIILNNYNKYVLYEQDFTLMIIKMKAHGRNMSYVRMIVQIKVCKI